MMRELWATRLWDSFAGIQRMRPGAAPLSEQIAILLLGPPIMSAFWWLASRNFGRIVQGGSVSARTKQRQKKEFWVLLVGLYLLGFGIILYAAFAQD
jgi:hypothetical protein